MRIDTTNYVAAMKKKPAGAGCWRFSIAGRAVWFDFMTYAEARKAAVRKAEEWKADRIFLFP